MVAPFTGAWIETMRKAGNDQHRGVAPFTGAWIETVFRGRSHRRSGSLPSRERGSKLPCLREHDRRGRVAPFTGAWIETLSSRQRPLIIMSLPSRERGSKQGSAARRSLAGCRSLHGSVDRNESRTLRTVAGERRSLHGSVDRNLPARGSGDLDRRVAPFTGAWIETWNSACAAARPRVAPFTGAWIETNTERLCLIEP